MTKSFLTSPMVRLVFSGMASAQTTIEAGFDLLVAKSGRRSPISAIGLTADLHLVYQPA